MRAGRLFGAPRHRRAQGDAQAVRLGPGAHLQHPPAGDGRVPRPAPAPHGRAGDDQRGGNAYFDKLQTLIAGGAAPDMFIIQDSWQPFFLKSKLALNLDPLARRDRYDLADFPKGAIESYRHEGGLYGLPDNITSHGFFVNLDLFKQAGVAPPPTREDTRGWTFDVMLQRLQQLVQPVAPKPTPRCSPSPPTTPSPAGWPGCAPTGATCSPRTARRSPSTPAPRWTRCSSWPTCATSTSWRRPPSSCRAPTSTSCSTAGGWRCTRSASARWPASARTPSSSGTRPSAPPGRPD